jgi:hypothetical protein
MKKLLTAFFLLLSFHTFSQTFNWAHSFGGANEDNPNSIQVDVNGNVYVCAVVRDTFDIDPGPGVVTVIASFNATLIAKFDPQGNYLWHFLIGVATTPSCLRFTDPGHFVVTGEYGFTTIALDPGSDSTMISGPGAFIAKYDTAGNMVWGNNLANCFLNSFQMNSFFTTDATGNIYLTGKAQVNTDLDPGPNVSTPGNGPFIAKYDASGNYIFSRVLEGNSSNAHGVDIAVDASGSIYLTGIFNYDLDLDPGPGVASFLAAGFNNFDDIFFSKYASDGSYINGMQIGGIGLDGGACIQFDDSGNVFLAGSFNGTADFDRSAVTHSLTGANTDLFLAKYDSALNYKWVKQMGGSNI